MSRLYDALRQASFSSDVPNSTSRTEGDNRPSLEDFINIPVAAATRPASLEEADEAKTALAAVLTALESPPTTVRIPKREPALEVVPDRNIESVADPIPDPWVISQPDSDPQPASQRQHGVPGTLPSRIILDRSVRAIPNATNPSVVEHYRRLRTKLMQQHEASPFRSLLVTSPCPNEGKTVTTLNLALSFAMLPNFKVLLVDGDLRRGSMGKWMGLGHTPGLSNLLEGTATLDEIVVKSDELPIQCVASGNSQLSAAELLHSNQISSHFRSLTSYFDLVLVDSPPVNVITDAQLLAAHCDAVLLVARAFTTTRKELEKAAQDLQPFRVIGTVLNGGTKAQLYRQYGGYY